MALSDVNTTDQHADGIQWTYPALNIWTDGKL